MAWLTKRRAARAVAWGAGALLLLVGIGVVVLTMTDFGRERVRLFSVEQLAKRIHGDVTVENVSGNLLSGATLEHVTITDTAGHPFLTADTLSFRYSMRSLFQKHLVFTRMRLVRPIVVFDQRPGGDWNVSEIFQGDSVAVPGDTLPGFGDWVRIEDLAVVDGRVTVKRLWRPDGASGGDDVDDEAALAEALAPGQRAMIATAPGGGFQAISVFDRIDGRIPLVRLADPDSAARVVVVDSLSTLALPFRPPAARVRDLVGRITITGSTLGFDDVRVRLPDSRLTLDGAYAFGGEEEEGKEIGLRLVAEPVSLPDLRWLRPSLPEGGGTFDVALGRGDGRTRLVARDVDLRVAGGRVQGSLEVATGDGGTRLAGSDIAFEGIDTDTVEELAGLDVPVEGVLAGRLALSGTADELDVEGWSTIRERSGALSRVEGDGVVVNGPEGVVARDLALRLEPLQLSLARELWPDLPLRGQVAGLARLDGPLESAFTVDADLVHRSPDAGRSRVAVQGGVRVEGELAVRGLAVRLDPLQAEVVRAFAPDFPVGGTVTGRATLDGVLASALTVDADLVHASAETGRSRVVARGAVRFGEGLVARDLRLRFDPLQAELVEAFAPDFPVDGVVTGTATVDGDLRSAFRVDADLVHDGPATGRSRVVAEGGVRVEGGFAARDLRVRMDPLHMELLRAFAPEVPLQGSLEGTATVSGSPSGRLAFSDLDVVHRGPGGTSDLEGAVAVDLAAADPVFDVDVRAGPLALATLDPFVPGVDLRGSVSGSIVLRGNLSGATLDADLTVADGGAISAEGRIGVGATARYDLSAVVDAFDASAVVTGAPATALTGRVAVAGTGTDPATANATIDAALVDSRAEGLPRFDSTRVVARLDDGLATFERSRISLAAATAEVEGSFGLVAGRTGELRYVVTVDSLSNFEGLVPPAADTGVAPERPLPRAERMAVARADSATEAEDRLVERLATGEPVEPPVLDTAPPLPRDSVSGSVRAEGVLVGNVERFNTRGTAVLEDVVLRGSAVGSGRLAYTAEDVLAPEMRLATEGTLEQVRVAGFAFDEATLDLTHVGGWEEGSGEVEVALVQDDARDYAVQAEYQLSLDAQEIRLRETTLRFDTATWSSTGPGTIRWAGRGIELEHIELSNGGGGRIFADGRLSESGATELRLEVDSLPLAHVAGLIQDTVDTHGILSLDATVTGTLQAPVMEGTLALDRLRRDGRDLPDVLARFDYVDGELVARTELTQDGRTLLEGDVRLPIDLALAGGEGPRLLEGTLSGDLELDSLPLQDLPLGAIPGLAEQVQDPRGWVRGEVQLGGTLGAPELTGDVLLSLASVHLPEPNLTLTGGWGHFALRGDHVSVDSLAVTSDGGPLRVTGAVNLETLTRPELDLHVASRDALLLDNERGRVRADVDLDLAGPLASLDVRGDVHVQSGEIKVPEPERTRRVTDLSDPLVVRALDTLGVAPDLRPGLQLLERMAVDVDVRIDRNTWLRNTDLHVEVYTPDDEPPLHVVSEPRERTLSLTGVVHTDRGAYVLAGRELELNSGSVTFLGLEEPDPLLQLNVQHEVPRRGQETLVILVNVSGYLSAPRLSLSSNAQPPLPESDLISYLAFGQGASSLLASQGSGLMGGTLGSLGVLAEQQLAGLGLGALTDAFVSKLEREGTETGLDVFRVRPGALPDELNYSSYFSSLWRGVEIEGGEYLGERLFVSARARPVGQALPGLQVEYRTPSGFSWITTWDPQYLPSKPRLGLQKGSQERVFGTFLLWHRRF